LSQGRAGLRPRSEHLAHLTFELLLGQQASVHEQEQLTHLVHPPRLEGGGSRSDPGVERRGTAEQSRVVTS